MFEADKLAGISFPDRGEVGFGTVGSGPALMEVVRRKSDSRRGRKRRRMTLQGVVWISLRSDDEVCFVDGRLLVGKFTVDSAGYRCERKHCSLYKKNSQCKRFGRMLETKQCLARQLGVFRCWSMTNLFLTTQYWVTDQKNYTTPMGMKLIRSNHLDSKLAFAGA